MQQISDTHYRNDTGRHMDGRQTISGFEAAEIEHAHEFGAIEEQDGQYGSQLNKNLKYTGLFPFKTYEGTDKNHMPC